MKDFIIRLAFLIVLLVILPGVMIYVLYSGDDTSPEEKTICLIDIKTKKITDIALEDYIIGVVAAEMPASFETEALKAQAVAARTYALRKINSNAEIHSGADLCTDYAHCQAYISVDEMRNNWGKDFVRNYNKICHAVESTCGEYLSYNDEFAITVFHSCSNGITERAQDVWGGDIPYLVNVDSPGDYEKPDFESDVTFTREEVVNAVSEILGHSPDTTNIPPANIEYSQGQNVNSIMLFGHKISGVELRKKLGLKSTAFNIENSGENYIFHVSGSGHGVGMSQYGANGYARSDKDYKFILSHYYPGTELCNLYK